MKMEFLRNYTQQSCNMLNEFTKINVAKTKSKVVSGICLLLKGVASTLSLIFGTRLLLKRQQEESTSCLKGEGKSAGRSCVRV